MLRKALKFVVAGIGQQSQKIYKNTCEKGECLFITFLIPFIKLSKWFTVLACGSYGTNSTKWNKSLAFPPTRFDVKKVGLLCMLQGRRVAQLSARVS
jgi:hypothetical protein